MFFKQLNFHRIFHYKSRCPEMPANQGFRANGKNNECGAYVGSLIEFQLQQGYEYDDPYFRNRNW